MKSATGRRVSGNDVFGRETEPRILESRVSEFNHVFLTGQRRMGKTSLVRELARKLESEGWACLFTQDAALFRGRPSDTESAGIHGYRQRLCRDRKGARERQSFRWRVCQGHSSYQRHGKLLGYTGTRAQGRVLQVQQETSATVCGRIRGSPQRAQPGRTGHDERRRFRHGRKQLRYTDLADDNGLDSGARS